MSNPKLDQIRRLVLADRYQISGHVLDCIARGGFDFEAIKHSIVHAQDISGHKDEKETAVDGRKYVITGPDPAGLAFRTVGKIQVGFDGKEYFIIAAFGVK